jgi:CRP-like cAMP-binding protein
VTHDGQVLRTMGPGDFFGEIAILGPQGRRTATVTAVDDVVVWELFGTVFRTLQMESPDVAQALEQAMRTRLDAG